MYNGNKPQYEHIIKPSSISSLRIIVPLVVRDVRKVVTVPPARSRVSTISLRHTPRLTRQFGDDHEPAACKTCLATRRRARASRESLGELHLLILLIIAGHHQEPLETRIATSSRPNGRGLRPWRSKWYRWREWCKWYKLCSDCSDWHRSRVVILILIIVDIKR